MNTFLNFHHFGLAVSDFDSAERYYKMCDYQFTPPITDKLQNVIVKIGHLENSPSIELVKPYGNSSPIKKILKLNMETIYHTCYEVKKIEEAVRKLRQDFRLIRTVSPRPALLFDNRLVGFYYIRGVGLIELLEEEK